MAVQEDDAEGVARGVLLGVAVLFDGHTDLTDDVAFGGFDELGDDGFGVVVEGDLEAMFDISLGAECDGGLLER
ncbi:MAG: hypothetical protein ACLFVZ_08395 [Actinomycetota bacterium]